MTPKAGQRLLHHRLVEQIGEGGMGVVWRAVDTSLDREVAIKMLPAVVAQDPERLARFEREARLLATLNHPHIATIHGLYEAEGIRFLAMELIDGEDLSQRLERGPLGVDETLEITRQICDALTAAHSQGIIHRDLKPANIKLTTGGKAKVLDFGLAKALAAETSGSPSLTMSPTVTSAGSSVGMIMGSAGYMSPEQARARPVDGRADVWALACVVYEMLSAKKAFPGDSISDTLAAILKEQPDWAALPEGRARALRPALERCLVKDPELRLHHPADARLRLEEALEQAAAEGEAADTPLQTRGTPRWSVAVMALLGALAVTTGVLWWTSVPPEGVRTPRLTVTQQTFQPGVETFPSLSPDGTFLAYGAAPDGGRSDIWLERVGGSNPINLTNNPEGSDEMPAFSPDGASIAFSRNARDGGIFVMGATGEAVRRVTDSGFDPAWSPDGRLLAYATSGSYNPLGRNRISALWIVNADGTERREVFAGDAMQPDWSPRALRIAAWSAYSEQVTSGQRDIYTIRPDGTDRVAVTDDAAVDWNPVWSNDGRHLYFVSDRGGSMNLWRVAIDEASGRVLDAPEPVSLPAGWGGPFALTGGGTLAYVNQQQRSNIARMPFDPTRVEITGPIQPVIRGTLRVAGYDLSPDSKRLAFRSSEVTEDLYLANADGSALRRLTDDPYRDRGPSWTADGESVLFYSNRTGRYEIWSIRDDGSELTQLTTFSGDGAVWYPRMSPNGNWIAAYNADGTYLLELAGEPPHDWAQAQRLPTIENATGTVIIRWSPDSRYAASGQFIWDLEQQQYRHLTDDEGGVIGWLPDGRILLGAAGELSVLDLTNDTRTPVALSAPLPENAHLPALSPDGLFLYAQIGSIEADIWIAEIE